MKNLQVFLIILCLSISGVFAQAPEKLSYQAIVRNSNSMVLANTNISMRVSILKTSANGTAVYVETQTPTTNANGLVSIEIGAGTKVSGTFNTINWANNIYFIKTEIDIAGGSSYNITGTSQLISVPYALHAKTAEKITGDGFIGLPPGGTKGQVLNIDDSGNHAWTDLTSTINIEDNLTSTSTTDALSANQGKVLKELVDINTAKTGITTEQATDISNNKTGVANNLAALANKVDKITGKGFLPTILPMLKKQNCKV